MLNYLPAELQPIADVTNEMVKLANRTNEAVSCTFGMYKVRLSVDPGDDPVSIERMYWQGVTTEFLRRIP